MADAKEVFRRSTMNRIASSDELDHYIKVTNPSAWAVVLAAILLVGGVFVWAMVATVPVTVETTGVAMKLDDSGETTVLCWVDKETADRAGESGLKAAVDGVAAEYAAIGETPMSFYEVISYLGVDYYAEKIDLDDWNYMVTIKPGAEPSHTDFSIATPQGEAHLVPVSVIVSETRPINIVLGKKD